MKMFDGKFSIGFSEYRPCRVNGRKALFHRLADRAVVVGESALRGGHSAGQVWNVVAVVEYDDGTMHECYPHEVRFLDSARVFREIYFGEADAE